MMVLSKIKQYMEQDFDLKLDKFWQQVQEELDPVAERLNNISYYIFQSTVSHNPRLMLVGINPGGDFTGMKSLINPCVPEYCTENNLNSSNWYISGSLVENNDFANMICDVFGYRNHGKLSTIFENAVAMNNIYINTGSISKLNKLNAKDAERLCGCFTKTLIDDIIQPETIITMGKTPFFNLKNKPVEVLSYKDIKIEKSFRNNIPVYNIPNPSKLNRHLYNGKTEQYRELLESILL
jgi:hypothetical protein